MESIIKYKRYEETFDNQDDIQVFFDNLIKTGFEIIYYNEIIELEHHPIKPIRKITIIAVCAKKNK